MLSIEQVSHSYVPGKPIAFRDWHVAPGEQWLLIGRSGSGKTTLLHILSGLLRPSRGKVVIAGTELYTLRGTPADRFRGQHIGLILQKPHLLPTLTVQQNLLLAQYMAGLKQDKNRIQYVLETLQMMDKRYVLPHTLSQGEAQRVSIARAVLNQPRLILADEPTASLDDDNCAYVLELIERQAAECQATLVIATHDARVKERISRQFILPENTAEERVSIEKTIPE